MRNQHIPALSIFSTPSKVACAQAGLPEYLESSHIEDRGLNVPIHEVEDPPVTSLEMDSRENTHSSETAIDESVLPVYENDKDLC
jgi:hypothetical protein